ncbi:MAG: class I adenylate-forming enzyme family protein [Acidimicrobiales bacterium]
MTNPFIELEAQLTGPGGAFETQREVIDGVEMTTYVSRFGDLRQVAQFAAAAHGDKEFIVYGDRRITFAEFFDQANTASASLSAAGVAHGDRVAVLSQNNPEWCISFWATVDIGAVLVGLNGWWTTDEVLYGLDDSGAKVLVADRKRFERIRDEIDGIAGLERVYLVDADPSEFPGPDGTPSPKLHRFADLTTPAPDAEPAGFPTVELTEADHAVIFYTSGTTGRPKGAISTHRSMIANLQNTVFIVTAGAMLMSSSGAAPGGGSSSQPVALFTSPLFHVSGCHSTLVVGCMGGMKLVMVEGRFDPVHALELIEAEKVTTWSTVPTMIWRTCELPQRHDFDTSTVTNVGFGGSPSADELQRRIRETFPNVRGTNNAYGLTETSSVATVLTGADALTKADSVGRPVPTVDIAIDDGNGGHAPAGVTGEVLITGPILMAGYWNKPEATATAIRDGWLHTGDIGHVDEEGFLYITDRAKDMIIRGGENIYCVEIENCLVEMDGVADAAIVGVPHPELGEEVKAFVELQPGAQLTAGDVQQWVGRHLAPFKVPTYVEVVADKLPRNASGKLLKNVLRGEGDVSFQETM